MSKHLKEALTLMAGGLALSTGAFAAQMNDTGMTRCTTADGLLWAESCVGSGQDGEFGRDVTNPRGSDGRWGFAFRKICRSGEAAGQGQCPADPAEGPGADDWGCVLDRVMWRMWALKTTDGSVHDASQRFTHLRDGRAGDAQTLADAANSAGLCGSSGWRLPRAAELIGLLDFGAKGDALIDRRWFPHAQAFDHWVSDPDASHNHRGWWVGLGAARNPGSSVGHPQWLLAAMIVSGAAPAAPAASTPRYTIADSGEEVLDNRTGLVWRRCSEGQAWDGSMCAGAPLEVLWLDAVKRAQAEAQRTGIAWRLPNVKELASLLDHTREEPVIDPVAFPQTGDLYWSSTQTVRPAPVEVRDVSFSWGMVAYTFLNEFQWESVRLVRDGSLPAAASRR